MVMKEGKICSDRRPGMNKNVVPVTGWKIIDDL
jgi:hypothetical protein